MNSDPHWRNDMRRYCPAARRVARIAIVALVATGVWATSVRAAGEREEELKGPRARSTTRARSRCRVRSYSCKRPPIPRRIRPVSSRPSARRSARSRRPTTVCTTISARRTCWARRWRRGPRPPARSCPVRNAITDLRRIRRHRSMRCTSPIRCSSASFATSLGARRISISCARAHTSRSSKSKGNSGAQREPIRHRTGAREPVTRDLRQEPVRV